MIKQTSIITGCATLATALAVAVAIALPGTSEEQPSAPGELLVTFHAGIAKDRIQAINKAIGVEVLGERHGRTYLIRIPPGMSLTDTRAKYLTFSEVEDVESNYVIKPQGGALCGR